MTKRKKDENTVDSEIEETEEVEETEEIAAQTEREVLTDMVCEKAVKNGIELTDMVAYLDLIDWSVVTGEQWAHLATSEAKAKQLLRFGKQMIGKSTCPSE